MVILNTILIFISLLICLAWILKQINGKFPLKSEAIVDKINQLLPQTQCAQCGYLGCLPYAKAVVNKQESIDKCVPGGQQVIDQISEVLGVQSIHNPNIIEVKKVAHIDEQECIGCKKCIDACPVLAIIGTTKKMHTVISSLCTGCDLCVPVCPVDCIHLYETGDKYIEPIIIVTS